MKFKTVRRVLKKKMKHWVDSVEDKEIASLIGGTAMICGGAIPSLIMGEKVNDYDVYFKTGDAAAKVAAYYVKLFQDNPPPRFAESAKAVPISVMMDDNGRVRVHVKSAGIAGEGGDDGLYRYFETLPPDQAGEAYEYVQKVVEGSEEDESDPKAKNGYWPRFLTSNAITLTGQVQIVLRFYGTPEAIFENYDFTHCKCCYDPVGDSLEVSKEALECMINRELSYSTSKYPLCSFIRIRKFLGRGWHINAGQFVKMAWDLNKLDLSDVATLEDQMIGVDTAYFREVIGMLQERKREGKPLDDSFLFEVIDKVF